MTKQIYLIGLLFLFISACAEDESISGPSSGPPSVPPTANFSKLNHIIIADKTNARFQNTSSGDIDSYTWEFENGQKNSYSEDANHIFEFAGAREVKLRVKGPGGSDEKKLDVVVHAFDPNCKNFSNYSTQSTTKIESLRDNSNIKGGTIRIRNNYEVSVDFLLYSPADWLNGDYTSTYKYSFESGQHATLFVNNAAFQYSNAWGIRVQGANGVISCIRNVGAVSLFNAGKYDILASDILDGK